MAGSTRICYLTRLISVPKKIHLPHNKPVIIGRNEITGIEDEDVPPEVLKCTADHDECMVFVEHLTTGYAACDGYALLRNITYHLEHGDRLEIVSDKHKFDVVFETKPEPGKEETEPSAKKPKLESRNNSGQWEQMKELLIYTSDDCKPQPLIASFDLDGTIIKTKSGARFPKTFEDWELNINSIPQKMKQLHDKNYKIVIFSNQSGVGNDSGKIKGFKSKIESILAKLSIPAQVFIATGRSIYRKPAPGMWNILCEKKNGDVTIDIDRSFYIGDAAGREKDWAPKKNKDHSVSDRLFALNIGLRFHTPEEYFLKYTPVPFNMPDFDPRRIPDGPYPHLFTDEQNVVVMVGSPGSGKSFFCKTYLVPKGYIYVSRDKLGTWQKCAAALEDCIKKKQNVVVDNTNANKESRKRYVDVAKEYGISCRCFVMKTTHKHAMHNNRFREMTDKTHVPISDIIIHSYKKGYEEPEMDEGFSEIVKIPFIPKFTTDEHEKLYKMFLLEN